MKFIKYIALTLFALIIVVGVAGLFLPDTRHVEREITIHAPAEEIFPYVNNFHKFNQWSPWARVDPNTRYQYEGPDAGVGAKMKWSSENKTVGSGTQEIVESTPDTHVRSLLMLGKNDLSMSTFTLSTTSGMTTVVWEFEINLSGTISRYFGLLMDDWVGHSYEQGLSELKAIIESQS